MTTVIDNKEDDFVKDLALTELNRLKVNIDEFLVKHFQKESEVSEEKIEKQIKLKRFLDANFKVDIPRTQN